MYKRELLNIVEHRRLLAVNKATEQFDAQLEQIKKGLNLDEKLNYYLKKVECAIKELLEEHQNFLGILETSKDIRYCASGYGDSLERELSGFSNYGNYTDYIRRHIEWTNPQVVLVEKQKKDFIKEIDDSYKAVVAECNKCTSNKQIEDFLTEIGFTIPKENNNETAIAKPINKKLLGLDIIEGEDNICKDV